MILAHEAPTMVASSSWLSSSAVTCFPVNRATVAIWLGVSGTWRTTGLTVTVLCDPSPTRICLNPAMLNTSFL